MGKASDSAPAVGLLSIGCKRFVDIGKDTLRGRYAERVNKRHQELRAALSQIATVVEVGVVYNDADLRANLVQFRGQSVNLIVATFLSWAEDDVWIHFVRDFAQDVPLVYFSEAFDAVGFETCEADDDFVEFLSRGNSVGALIGSATLARYTISPRTVVGSVPELISQIQRTLRAAEVARSLQNARFGLLGSYNTLMKGTYVDPYLLQQYGPDLSFISYAEYDETIHTVSDERVNDYRTSLNGLESDVASTSDNESLNASIRASLAMADLMEDHDMSALALNDVDTRLFELIGLRPGFYPRELNRKGRVVVPEGDLGMAFAALLLKRLSGSRVNVVEPFMINRASGTFLAGHAGPNDHNVSPELSAYTRVAPDLRFRDTPYKHAGAPLGWHRIIPGEMTFLNVTQVDGELRLVVFQAEAIDGYHTIPSYAHGEFRPIGNVRPEALLSSILSVGTTQHFAIVAGNWIDDVAEFAKLGGTIELGGLKERKKWGIPFG